MRPFDWNRLRGIEGRTLVEQRPVVELRDGLEHHEEVVYTNNGNRTMAPEAFLRRIMEVAPLAGMHRLADISRLAEACLPVFQSCRPDVFWHPITGQNTGAQGKGSTAIQAQISCVMETIEGFCQEPRSPRLIRGSYRYLAGQHVVLDPRHLELNEGATAPGPDDPVMWTPAYSVELDREILVPAEIVYFPFLPSEYGVKSRFPAVTNGVAAGATYLEAVTHSLYEVIESYYIRCLQERRVEIEELDLDRIDSLHYGSVPEAIEKLHHLRVYTLRLREARNLPMACAYIKSDYTNLCAGYGCAGDVETAVSRAISEAVQGLATAMSGSREDLPEPYFPPEEEVGEDDDEGAEEPESGEDADTDSDSRSSDARYAKRTLDEYRRLVEDHGFRDLRSEYESIVDWLHELGFEKICIANLTRTGIDIPVVKTLVPRMPPRTQHKVPVSVTPPQVVARKYGWS